MKINIGKRIRYYRELNGLSQSDLAAKLNISRKTISSWEIDRTEPNIGKINEMSKIFGCTAEQLVGVINADEINEYTPDQLDVLMLYNKLSPSQKKAFLDLLITMGSTD